MTNNFGDTTRILGSLLGVLMPSPSLVAPGSTLFGSRNRTAILIAIRMLETTHVSELAAMLGLRLFTVQETVRTLEPEQAIVARAVGRTRQLALNPRYLGHASLADLLWQLGSQDHDLQQRLATIRRRPRRTGKAVA